MNTHYCAGYNETVAIDDNKLIYNQHFLEPLANLQSLRRCKSATDSYYS